MRCPTLEQLPPPLPNKTGWPWTEESPQLPDTMPDGRPWPRISIVTPSYQQGQFIEETIRSVLLQGYPDLEYIVIDGGSTDSSVDIIRKYADWLTYWVSEPDRGQAHAINKGFSLSSGKLLNWINSDDMLLPAALSILALGHIKDPTAMLLGDVENFYEGEKRIDIGRQINVALPEIICLNKRNSLWHQPGIFVPRSLYELVGPLDEALRYAFDHDWLYRLTQRAHGVYLAVPVARFRIHPLQKTTAELPGSLREIFEIIQRYWDILPNVDKHQIRADYHSRMAALHLGLHHTYAPHWNRREGLRHLSSSFWQYPPVIKSPLFLKLLRRALLPKRLLRSPP
jgi:glycosyltransferase involved in cell wall biosynthesis